LSQDGWSGPQETGITGGSQTVYGPMHQDYYGKNMAITHYQSDTHDILLNPDASSRKRLAGEPAFLRPTSKTERLAALITILQNIPIARRALIFQGYSMPSYGHHPDWWDGQPINLGDIYESQGSESPELSLIVEVQRLMAFLGSTSRSYGSVEPLRSILDALPNTTGDVVGHFLKAWRLAANEISENDYADAEVFSSWATTYELSRSDQYFNNLVMALDESAGLSIYDRIDSVFWGDAEEAGRFLSEVGDVFIISPSIQNMNGRPCSGMHVPAILYLDRYLEQNQLVLKQERHQRAKCQKELTSLGRQMKHFTQYRHSRFSETTFDPLKLLAAAAECFGSPDTDDGANSSTPHAANSTPSSAPSNETVIDLLRAAYDRVSSYIQNIESRQQKLQQQIQSSSKVLTDPNAANPAHRPKLKYRLTGVTMNLQVVYVLRPLEQEHRTLNTPDAVSRGYQWWKIEISSSGIMAVEKTKVPEAEVLKAARQDTKEGLLVYASEQSLNVVESSLPESLEKFVQDDNAAFGHELDPSSPTPLTSAHQLGVARLSTIIEQPTPVSPTGPDFTTQQNGSTDSNAVDARKSPKRRATSPPEAHGSGSLDGIRTRASPSSGVKSTASVINSGARRLSNPTTTAELQYQPYVNQGPTTPPRQTTPGSQPQSGLSSPAQVRAASQAQQQFLAAARAEAEAIQAAEELSRGRSKAAARITAQPRSPPPPSASAISAASAAMSSASENLRLSAKPESSVRAAFPGPSSTSARLDAPFSLPIENTRGPPYPKSSGGINSDKDESMYDSEHVEHAGH
jgi:hypothetical protein